MVAAARRAVLKDGLCLFLAFSTSGPEATSTNALVSERKALPWGQPPDLPRKCGKPVVVLIYSGQRAV